MNIIMDEEVIKYQQFFEHFLSSVNSADQLPVKIIVPTTTKAEVKGAVLDWILQYLHSWNFPKSLVSPLAKIILDDVKPSLEIDICPYYNDQQNVYSPIPLMQFVIGKIQEICQRFVDGKQQYPSSLSDSPHYTSVFASKNRRRSMEDCFVIITDLDVLFDVKNIKHVNYYAVFDGHNGNGAASYSSAHLHQFLVESQFYPLYPQQALNDAFKVTDRHLLDKDDLQFKRSGTTAVCILWHKDEKMLYSAWVGDSEAILAKKGKVFRLVNPHKAGREDERQRISDMKGVVLFWGSSWRVDGQLAISRAIGDSEHKPYVSSNPDIISLPLEGDEDFIILACDGLWDSVTHEQAAQVVYSHVTNSPDNYDQVSQILTKHAKTAGSEDNITVIVVFLTDPHLIKLPTDNMETATAESFNSKQNGASFCSIGDIKNNFDHVNDNDDFGPETNVDDDLISQSVSAKKSFTTFDKLNCNNPFAEFENHKIQEETDSAKNDNLASNDKNAVSDESDEEEWNYFKGEENSTSKTNNLEKSSCSELDASSQDIEYSLNPDAAEFVPLSPTSSKKSFDAGDHASLKSVTPEVRQLLLHDEIVASSPMKGHEKSMDAVDVPSLNDFDSEIRKRPSNIMPIVDFDSDSTDADTQPATNDTTSLNNSFGISEADTSTKVLVGDDSCFSSKLEDVNDVMNESTDNNFSDNDDKDDFLKLDTSSEVVENGVSDDEDHYPSIVEKEKPLESAPSNDEALSSAQEREVPAFSEKQNNSYEFPSLDPNDEVISTHMTTFSDNSQTHSLMFCANKPVFTLSNSKQSSPVAEELLSNDEKIDHSEKSQSIFSANNPFADDQLPVISPKKDTSAEKDTDVCDNDETDLRKNSEIEFDVVTNEAHETELNKKEVPNFMSDFISDSNHTSEFSNDFCHFGAIREQTPELDISVETTVPSQPESNAVEELVCVKETVNADVEANPVVGDDHKTKTTDKDGHEEKHESTENCCDKELQSSELLHEEKKDVIVDEKHDSEEKEQASLTKEQASFEQIERRLSFQILDEDNYLPKQFSAEECDRLEDVTVLSDVGDPNEPITSVDLEAPYIHDCGRLDDKPGSVHHHATHSKHYSELLPDVTSTMESDKLESELRESEAKAELEPILAPSVQSAEDDESFLISKPKEKENDIVSSVKEVPSTPPAQPEPSHIATAVAVSAVAATAVATASAAAAAASTTGAPETKKSVSSVKKSEEKAKPATKTGAKPLLSTLTKAKTSTSSAAPKIDLKKPATSTTANKLTSPRTSAPAARPTLTAKTSSSTTAPRTSVAAKSTVTVSRAAPSNAATTKPPVKLSSPAKPKIPSSTTAAAKVTSNGDVSSTKTPATRRPVSTTTSSSNTLKKVPGAAESSSMKPAVNLSTRVSLAPKPRTTTTSTTKSEPVATASKVSSLAAKRPISAPAKVTNKDTKDITNKRLSSAAKSSPTKSSPLTNGKTESKTTTTASMPSPIRKPIAAAVSVNQSN